jgi:hypothetical protein
MIFFNLKPKESHNEKNTLSTIREFIKTRAEEFPPACSFLRYILENSEHEEMGPEVEKYIMDFIKDPQKEGGGSGTLSNGQR